MRWYGYCRRKDIVGVHIGALWLVFIHVEGWMCIQLGWLSKLSRSNGGGPRLHLGRE